MEYVVKQAKVTYDSNGFSIPEIIIGHYPGAFTTMPETKEVLTIQFPKGGATLEIWSEPAETISGFEITRTTADFYHPKPGTPSLDRMLLARRALEIVVRNSRGEEIDAKGLRAIPFGFDTKIVEGEFYWSPSLGFYYWLRKIEGDSLRWVLIEDYQHGQFLQVEFIQHRKHSKGMVLVEDKEVRERLDRRRQALLSAEARVT
jgi:hypothetical protein